MTNFTKSVSAAEFRESHTFAAAPNQLPSMDAILPVLLFVAIAAAVSVGLVVVADLIGPRRSGAVKEMPYESGMDPVHDTRRRFDVRFHLVAITFLVFDVELLFLYPWAVASRSPAGLDAAVAEGLVSSRGLVGTRFCRAAFTRKMFLRRQVSTLTLSHSRMHTGGPQHERCRVVHPCATTVCGTADGAPVSGPGPERGVVFQQNALFPWLTLAQNIRFGLDEQGLARSEADVRVDAWIRAVGLEAFADQRPGALSGGMAQRVALARALAPEPGALLLDEPFGALDRITRGQMQELLVSVWRRTRATLLLVTHDVEEALVVCDRVVVMSPRPGRVLADIPVDLPRPRTLSDRTSQEFVELRRQVEAVLHDAMSPIQ